MSNSQSLGSTHKSRICSSFIYSFSGAIPLLHNSRFGVRAPCNVKEADTFTFMLICMHTWGHVNDGIAQHYAEYVFAPSGLSCPKLLSGYDEVRAKCFQGSAASSDIIDTHAGPLKRVSTLRHIGTVGLYATAVIDGLNTRHVIAPSGQIKYCMEFGIWHEPQQLRLHILSNISCSILS
ncbi:hypothetical protein BDQ12DRAFT_479238 [Crucibulum laeve]|uniref:Uncharacterized protein n=1 Tax=Crucibulum laeve TaxID=68775 RepID=A0A5C3LIY1_9AGAR|nr:hypothetical protein BDQ12DRAFT_479238 [Crucibulum laeve]